ALGSQLETLPSLGLGLIFDPNRRVHAQIYSGYAFNRDLVPSGNNLQNWGIHFFISVNAFEAINRKYRFRSQQTYCSCIKTNSHVSTASLVLPTHNRILSDL